MTYQPKKWGNEMEIPSHSAYSHRSEEGLRHADSYAHVDGTLVFEIKSVTLDKLAHSAEFTDDVLAMIVKYDGSIHSFPAVMPELTGGLSAPEEFCKEECRPLKRDRSRGCGQWLGKHKQGVCNCSRCVANKKHQCKDRWCHERELSLCGTNLCWYFVTKGKPSAQEHGDLQVANPGKVEDYVMAHDAMHPFGRAAWTMKEDSYYFERGKASNHLHFSPTPSYNVFRRLFWLTRLYQQFFCNSPYVHEKDGVLLSLRRAGLPQKAGRSGRPWPRRTGYGNGYLLPRSRYSHTRENDNLTGNSLGTIEFRYNDMSKSAQTVLFYGYLAMIAPLIRDSVLPNRVGFKDFAYQFRKFEPTMMAFTECIEDVIGDGSYFWNAYTGDYCGWTELVKSMQEVEMLAFERFTTVTKWTEHWADYLGSKIPEDAATIKGNLKGQVAEAISALGGTHWDKVEEFNTKIGSTGAYI